MTEKLASVLDGPIEEADETPPGMEDSEEVESTGEDGVDPEPYDESDPPDKKETEEDKAEPEANEKPRAKSDHVPYGRFKEVNDNLKAEREARSRTEERLLALVKAQQEFNARQAEEQPPDPEMEPEAYAQHQERQIAELQNKVTEFRENQEKQTRAQEEYNKLYSYAAQQEDYFRDEHPDYDDAVIYASDYRVKELMAEGHSRKGAEDRLRGEIEDVMRYMQANGGNVAQYVYKKANDWGFNQSKEDKADPAKVKEEISASEAKKNEIKKKNKSVSTSGSATPDLTEMDIDDMNDQEFSEFMKGLFKESDPLRA